MSELERIFDWRTVRPQARVPGGDGAACLVTASPNSLSQSSNLDCHTAPSSICLFRLVESTMGLDDARAEAHPR